MKKAIKRGIAYEKRKAKQYGAKHVGGPKKEDARKGRKKYEMKDWKQKVHTGVLKKALRKGIKTIISKGGYTEPAKKYAKKHKMRLK